MHNCQNCQALEEALEILSQQFKIERQKRRELYRTIRLLKTEVRRSIEQEFINEKLDEPSSGHPLYNKFSMCQADGFSTEQVDE